VSELNGTAYVLFVWTPSGWVLREQSGEPPQVGDRIDADGRKLVVSKIGSSPLPGDRRRCVYTTAA
jgi:hypothetical protein